MFVDEKAQETERSIYRHLSAIKHGNPASSELGFQFRRSNGVITLLTGEIQDTAADMANDMMAGYATYHLARAAQAHLVTTSQYAICIPLLSRGAGKLAGCCRVR
jgi:hypothetical protein